MRALRNAPAMHLGLKEKILASGINPEVFVPTATQPAPASVAIQMEAECQATIEIHEDFPDWEAAHAAWLSGKPPTNSPEWKKGVFMVTL